MMLWEDGRCCSIKPSLAFWLSERGTIVVDTARTPEMNRDECQKLFEFLQDALAGKLVHPDDPHLKLR